MTQETIAEFGKILGKIQKLLALADHPNTSPTEAATFREKAESLMVEYWIEEEHLRSTGVIIGMQPIMQTWTVCYSGPFSQSYIYLAFYAADHVGAKFVQKRGRDEEGRYIYTFEVVGFESDVRYAELIFTAAKLVFQARMEAKLDPTLSDEINAYNLRASGMPRNRIAEMLGRPTAAGHAWVSKAYQAECIRRGEDPKVVGKGFNLADYRETYAEQFIYTFSDQLYQSSRNSAERGALVLASRKDEVQEAFYKLYPQYRPSTEVSTEKAKPYTPTKRDIAQAAKRNRDRWLRESSRAGQAGKSAGKAAAESVDFGGVAPVGRVES